jgi:hypothetical protein
MRSALWLELLEAIGAALIVAGLALVALPFALVAAGFFCLVASRELALRPDATQARAGARR